MTNGVYPVSEIFYSIQGEGAQSGTPMIFLRLAGCTVGKPYTNEEKKTQGLEIFQNRCKIYDSREFPCDTDYRCHSKMTIEEILQSIKNEHPKCKWVSITGGEPLMHDLTELLEALHSNWYYTHLETSGTIPISVELQRNLETINYIVVSPKFPFLDEYINIADEFRVLVDQDFNWDSLPDVLKNPEENFVNLYISPVNGVKSITESNVKKCLDIIRDHPEVMVSLQVHKIMGVR